MTELKDLMLRTPQLTLGIAESLTCGWVQMRVGETPGASNYFLGGITAYSLEQKVRHLGVDRAQAEPVNAVSAHVAEQMAAGACRLFGSDLGLATTGYAEPVPEQGIAQPFAYWGLAHLRNGVPVAIRSGRVESAGASRIDAQRRMADAVLAELVVYLRAFRTGDRSEEGRRQE